MYASVAVYLHPADATTSYRGLLYSSFLGDTGNESPVVFDVPPGKDATGLSHFGKIVSAAGAYEFRLALDATVPGHEEPHRVELAIPVRLVAARSDQRVASVRVARD
jgi:hypothetical protein